MEHKPATKLPWKVAQHTIRIGSKLARVAIDPSEPVHCPAWAFGSNETEARATAAYIAHAANAYPKLVEAARFALIAAEKEWADVLNSVGALSDAAFARASKERVFIERKQRVEGFRALLRELGESE